MDNNSFNQNNFNTSPSGGQDTCPLSLGQYLVMMLLLVIPLVNIILLFVWSFGNYNINKKNYARASLIMFAIAIVLWFILGAALTGIIMNSGYY